MLLASLFSSCAVRPVPLATVWFLMAEQQKRMRITIVGSMSTVASNAIVKREEEEEVERRVVVQAGGQAVASAAATIQAASMQGGDSSKFITVLMEKDRLHCTACFGLLKPPVYKCGAVGHKVCCTCRGDDTPGANSCCRACNGAAASFILCSDDYQELLGSPTVACRYKEYGCRRLVSCLKVDEHGDACPDKPCSCAERAAGCDGGFLGSPLTLHGHLAGPLHSWPTSKIEYGKTQKLEVTEPRRLLVAEGERRVFVLAVAEETADGITNVSLMCLRSDAAAAAGPHYKGQLIDTDFVVQSRASPCEIALREGTLLVTPKFLHGESRMLVLYVRINKLKPVAAQQ